LQKSTSARRFTHAECRRFKTDDQFQPAAIPRTTPETTAVFRIVSREFIFPEFVNSFPRERVPLEEQVTFQGF
jgi:hypothetical protein